MLIDETPSGQDAVWTTPDGTLHELFQYNDRGRGPKIYTNGLFGMVRQGFQSVHPALRTAQEVVENARAADLARALVHVPTGDVVITNVTLFDSENGVALAQRRVTIRGARIVAVQPESSQATSAAAEVIDGSGKMLLPGLWDMHAHLFPLNAYLDVAAGVTTARDLGNPIDLLTPLRTHIAEGTQIGPRVIAAGFIDGPGPFEGPIK